MVTMTCACCVGLFHNSYAILAIDPPMKYRHQLHGLEWMNLCSGDRGSSAGNLLVELKGMRAPIIIDGPRLRSRQMECQHA